MAPKTTTCCTFLRVFYHQHALTIYSAILLVGGLMLAQATRHTWATAAATFCGARLGWCLWVARPCSFTPGPLPAPHGEPAPGCSVLTAEQLDFFDRCGYLVLQQIIPKAEADRFVAETIIPGLRSRGVDPDDPSNWHTGEKWHIILPGCCRGHKNVANHNRCGAMVSSVVPDASQQYKPLYESEQLLGVLDDLHGTDDANELPGGGGDGVDGRSQATGEQTRRWEWLRPGLGNTHVRYPLPVRQRYAYPAQAAARLWNPPSLGWHIDGAHFQGHRVGSRQQSMIVLPVFGDVEPGGGATAIVAGSHKIMGRYLQKHDSTGGCSYMNLFLRAHWIYNGIVALGCGKRSMKVVQAAPCRAGDVLIMHPFLVHSASLNYSNDMRLAFNLGVRWRRVATAEAKQDNGASTTTSINDGGAVQAEEKEEKVAEMESLLGSGDSGCDEMLNMSMLLSEYRQNPGRLAPLPRSLARVALCED